MKYESMFSIGETVWMVRSEKFERIVKCKPCSNTGKIIFSGEEFICPKCHGRSSHTQYGGEKYYIYGDSIVGKVKIEDEPTRYHQEDPNPQYQYMLEDTGIGSGQVWNQEVLFATKEEAQRFCDLKNNALPVDETNLGKSIIDNYGKIIV